MTFFLACMSSWVKFNAASNSIKQENTSLKVKQDELVKEKAKLVEKTNLARTRVEAMISRLKTMEHGS
jgi:cell division protein ZapB